MGSSKQQAFLLLAILGTLLLQVALSAVLLMRVNAVASSITRSQQGLAGPASIAPEQQAEVIRNMSIEGAPSKGAADAEITIIVFADFLCPMCAKASPTLDQILDLYPTQVRIVHLDFPGDDALNSPSMQAAHAARCAGEQGLYWEMHDLLLRNQDGLTAGGASAMLDLEAQLDLDQESFAKCMGDLRYAKDIEADREKGIAAGIAGVPAIFINGRAAGGAVPLSDFLQVVEEELKK